MFVGGSWQSSVILVGSCFFYGSRAFLVILGGSWRFLVVLNDLLVFFMVLKVFFVLFLKVLVDSQ